MGGQGAGSGLPSSGALPFQVWAQILGVTGGTFSKWAELQHTGLMPGLSSQQMWASRTKWFALPFSGRWYDRICLGLHRKLLTAKGASGASKTRWDAVMVAVMLSHLLTSCLETGMHQHPSLRSFLEEFTGDKLTFQARLSWVRVTVKDPASFRQIHSDLDYYTAQDQGRPGKCNYL